MKSAKIFDLYLFRNLLVATGFVAITLTFVILLTQSLRFLELVVESGASSGAFWFLTMLALPRFFEVIFPLALMAATLFVYNRMTMDSEIVVMRATGISPLKLARPALILAMLVTAFLWIMTLWAAPSALAKMHHTQQIIKAQLSTLLFREGVFNSIIPGLTVYMKERGENGELHGIMIHDSRADDKLPSTIFARRGVVVEGNRGQEVLVYDGSRQEFNPETRTLNKLNFERYTIDLPDSNPIRERWQEPEERTIFELLSPDRDTQRDLENIRNFSIEIHRRLTAPLLSMVFTLIALNALLLGPLDRRGMGLRIASAIGMVVLLQGLFLGVFNLAKNSNLGLVLMYCLVFLPLGAGFFFLSGLSETFRRRVFYKDEVKS